MAKYSVVSPVTNPSAFRVSLLALSALLALLSLLCSGCAPAKFLTATEVKPLSGWVDYCKRNPQDHECLLGREP